MQESLSKTTTPPTHVAVIMDGNGRWAKKRGLPRIEGHRQGVDNVRNIVKCAGEIGIKYLTLYAFSVENWQRPTDEIDALMEMLERFLKNDTQTLLKGHVRLKVIGRLEKLPERVRQALENTLQQTAGFDKWTLILALNYGTRAEVVDAVKAYVKAVRRGREIPEELDWTRFARYLYTYDVPDPDLVIRTSGETRLSNFLLLQCAYAEMYFTPILWPDFGPEDFKAAVAGFMKRERRFGRTGEQIQRAVSEPVLNP